jgi:hypothetical protein
MSLSPEEMIILDLDEVEACLIDNGYEAENDELMVMTSIDGVSTTVYRTGRLMMHPMRDRDRAVEMGNRILAMLGVASARTEPLE